MSVPEGKRGEKQLQVFVKAEELATYTTKICANPNTFKVEYKDILTYKIVDTAQQIYIKSWKANNIVVKDKESATRRLRLEQEAHELCNELLPYIQMAKKVYHLKASRIKYWGELTIECRSLISKWKESDTRRYSEYK